MSELSDSIHRQRWGDIKGHGGKERLVTRSIHADRKYVKKASTFNAHMTSTEFFNTYDSSKLQKWLRKS